MYDGRDFFAPYEGLNGFLRYGLNFSIGRGIKQADIDSGFLTQTSI